MSAKTQRNRIAKAGAVEQGQFPPTHCAEILFQPILEWRTPSGALKDRKAAEAIQVCEVDFGKTIWEILNARNFQPVNQPVAEKATKTA